MKKILLVIIFQLFLNQVFAQTSVLSGFVGNVVNNEPIINATITIEGTTLGTISNIDGTYTISGLAPGVYNIKCQAVGFKTKIEYEVVLSNTVPAILNFSIESNKVDLKGVTIKANDQFYKLEQSPVSVRNLGVNEIQRTPGSNRDISKVLQSLPGVAATVSYRNDLLVRGGGPGENKFFIDGVEISNINHFATQGSTGGPVGLLNVDFIREAIFYSGAFPANRGNSTSSILELKTKEGRKDRWGGKLTTGYTASGLSLEGPINSKNSLLLSVRMSYLQMLFKQIGLPFLPTFYDAQFKYNYKINKKNEFMLMGLFGIDQFQYNKDAINNKDSARADYARFVLDYSPRFEQKNYTVGATWRNFREHQNSIVVLSANNLNNHSSKYSNNEENNRSKRIFEYRSHETEIKLRAENNVFINDYKVNYGAGAEYAYFDNASFIKYTSPVGIDSNVVNNKLSFLKYCAFTQVTHSYLDNLLTVSAGLRTDFNNYSQWMLNFLEQLSPRFSMSYSITQNMHLNFNTGVYYQLPAYTVLGYRNNAGELVNKQNKVKYIQSKHIVLGIDYFTKFNAKLAVEGFYKSYFNYPFSIRNQISLANVGSDFGVIGNEAVLSQSNGRAYGVEFSIQQKLYKGWYGIMTYTFVRSEFENAAHKFISSSWDYGTILNISLGKKFNRGYELSVKYSYQGGQPYTPYNIAQSMNINYYAINGQGIPDYTRLNSLRTQDLHNVDLRTSKKWTFKHWALDFYIDIQNVLGIRTKQQDFLTVQRDVNNNPIVNPSATNQYLPRFVNNYNGVRTPNLGLIVEF